MAFKLEKWPKRLAKNWQAIEAAINRITPTPGLGIDIDVTEGGSQISVSTAKPPGGTKEDNMQGGAGVGGGGTENLYGAKNAAPALFHVAITAPTTIPPP